MTVDAVGGVWRYAMELARALRPLGFDCVFAGLGPRPSPDQTAEAAALGILEWLDEPLDWMVQSERELAGVQPALLRLVRRHGIAIAHVNLPSQAIGLAAVVPTVAVSHSCMSTWWQMVRATPLPPEWEWRRKLDWRGFTEAAAVVAPSAAHAGQLGKVYGPVPRLSVVHNGISLNGISHNGISAQLPARSKKNFIFAAGRWWDEGKNGALLDAAATGLPWPVCMAGAIQGPAGDAVRFRSATALGNLPHGDVLELAAAAAIVASPSIYEPFGLAALEGARAGAALVLSDIPTYRELWLDAALFFDPTDADSLRRTLARLIADSGLRQQMGARAMQRSRCFTPDRQAGRMVQIYNAVAGVPADRVIAGE